jgi:DNA-binding MarR family transcriptional regulator
MTESATATSGRADRVHSIVDGLRRYATDAARLSQAFSSAHGLHAADVQALAAIMDAARAGEPLTPGRLRRHLGLSSGGTSYVIDRLAKAGHIQRERDHPGDNRVVHLHHTDQGMATGLEFFGPIGNRTREVLAPFGDGELDVIHRFVIAVTESLHEHITELETAHSRKDS